MDIFTDGLIIVLYKIVLDVVVIKMGLILEAVFNAKNDLNLGGVKIVSKNVVI